MKVTLIYDNEGYKEKLIHDAKLLIEAFKELGNKKHDPLIDPDILTQAITSGLLDAPDLKGNETAKGEIKTGIIDGACVSLDPITNKILPEGKRIKKILSKIK